MNFIVKFIDEANQFSETIVDAQDEYTAVVETLDYDEENCVLNRIKEIVDVCPA